jgi:hypothetical protein
MVHSVSSWFYEQSISKNPKVLRRCLIGSDDVSQYMKQWPSIKRDHTKLRPGNISINLANEDQTFNNFIADTLNLTKSIQLDLGFGGNPAVVDKLQGHWMADTTSETITSGGLDPDRHTTSLGLDVYGSIDKLPAATNAKVMEYSAFTGSAYLEQAYNAALDPGTDVWAYMGWAKSTDIASSSRIMERSHYTVSWSDSIIQVGFNNGGGIFFGISDDGAFLDSVTTTSAYDDGVYHLISCLRIESATNLYVDKTLVESAAINNANGTLTNSLATLRFGANKHTASALTDGTLAMWSAIIGAVPTNYDIGKIYDNEIGYLQPGGKEAPDDWVADRFNQVGEFLTVYEGGIGSISFARGLAKIQAEDKFNPLSHRVIGSRDTPVLMTDSFLPSDVFWTICTCYGGLSSVESTSNPDIDWAAFQTWAAVFSADSVFVSTKYEGDNCIKALRDLAHYTQSTIVTDPAKITPNRFSGIVTGDELLFDDSSIIDNTVVISEQTIINRQYVSGDYDPDVSSYGITVVKADSVSINSFGLHADTMEKTSIWYINSLSAVNLADRKISFNKVPSTAYRIDLPLVPLTRQIGDIITVADSSLSVASHSMRVMGYSINMDKLAMSLSADDTQLANPFLLDVSTLDGPELLL